MRTRLEMIVARLEGTLEAALACATEMVSQTSTGRPVDEIHNVIARGWVDDIERVLADVRDSNETRRELS